MRFTTNDNRRLRGCYWQCESPLGTVLISHGLGEHAGRYNHVARALSTTDHGAFQVLAFDYRGHGLSPGRRGVIHGYDEYLDDLVSAVRFLERNGLRRPLTILGHSQGALIALRAASLPLCQVDALILSSPALELSVPVSAWKLFLANALRKIAPAFAISGRVPSEWLSTRPGFADEHRADPLVHGKVCAHAYFGMKEWGARLRSDARVFSMPLLVLGGARDQVISIDAARELVSRWGATDTTIQIDPAAAHEPLNDHNTAELLELVHAWLRKRTLPSTGRVDSSPNRSQAS